MGNFCHPKADYNLSSELNFTTPSADGEYGCYILDSARQSQAMTAMPMTEGLCLSPDGCWCSLSPAPAGTATGNTAPTMCGR